MLEAPPPKIAEIEIALEKSHAVSPFKFLMFMFWGLILAKCCIVQWAILKYQAPIDGFIYVWIPSIIFGAVCTFVYAKVSMGEFRRAPMMSRVLRGVWCACAISMIILAVVGIGFKGYSPFLLPGLFAVLMGAGYYIHSILDSRQIFKVAAFGWWLSSIGLFYRVDLNTLAWLTLAIILFQSLPTLALYSQAIKKSKRITSQRQTL